MAKLYLVARTVGMFNQLGAPPKAGLSEKAKFGREGNVLISVD